MKKADLQVYFHDLQKRYDNMDTDPDVQRVDYQVMAHNALTVMKRIIDEGLDDEQKRLKAYHNGYDQGRFDEQAEQWLKANSQKAETKQWKSCPYCSSNDPDANAHAGAAYREWLEARTALGDRLHAYDVAQWEKESDQPSKCG